MMSMFATLPLLILYMIPIVIACYLMIMGIKALKIYIAKNQTNDTPKL